LVGAKLRNASLEEEIQQHLEPHTPGIRQKYTILSDLHFIIELHAVLLSGESAILHCGHNKKQR